MHFRTWFMFLSIHVSCMVCLTSVIPAQIPVVAWEQEITMHVGGFIPEEGDPWLGYAVAPLGDLDGDGVGDVAVGAPNSDETMGQEGAVFVFFLNTDGTVATQQKITQGSGGFGGSLDPNDYFGCAITAVGDLDGNGACDVAVGAWGDDDGGTGTGAVWILFLNADGTVANEQKISNTTGGLNGQLNVADDFGYSLTAVGDLNGDGFTDLAVGAVGDDDGASPIGECGAVWILFLEAGGSVVSWMKTSDTNGGFGTPIFDGPLGDYSLFGSSVACLNDLNDDGSVELAVGAYNHIARGAVFMLSVGQDGVVGSWHTIAQGLGGFSDPVANTDQFGWSLSAIGDLNGDGIQDLAVGDPGRDNVGFDTGVVWLLGLTQDGTVSLQQAIGEGLNGFGGNLSTYEYFGSSICPLGDLDDDGISEVAVGAYNGGMSQFIGHGAVWMLFFAPDTADPQLECPSSIFAMCSKTAPGEIVHFSVSASDNRDSAPNVVCAPPSGSFFPRGITMVTCTATDASGNQSVCQFPVVVSPPILKQRL